MNARLANIPENIRVCATWLPYRMVLTWYWSGDIYWLDRETDQSGCCGQAYTLDDFNLVLYEWEIMPVGMGRGRKEDRKPEYALTARLPF